MIILLFFSGGEAILALILMVLESTNFLVWNCRGAGNRGFPRHLKDLIDTHQPQILALLEPWASGIVADQVCSRIGWRRWYRVEANGFSWGIWIFWREERLEIKILHEHHQFVHLQITENRDAVWYATVVYASPNPTVRRQLWTDLRRIASKQPWCIN